MTNPVIEEVKNEGPYCLKGVGVVLIVVTGDAKKLQVHDVIHYKVAGVERFSEDLNRKE
jgi:hypothetical protein